MRLTTFVVGALLLMVSPLGADEANKRMLDDPLTFTGSETLDPARDAAEYRIGVFAPDSDDQPVGRDIVRGVSLAVEQANASGGVNGRRLKVVRRWADDPWGAGSTEVIRLVFEDRVSVVIGGPDGASTHVAQQIATKAHLPLIAPVTGDPSLTHTRVPWIFRLPPDDRVQSELLVSEGMVTRGVGRAALVMSNDHDGRTAARELSTAMARVGRPAAFELTVDPQLVEPKALASRLAELAPDAVVLSLSGQAVRRALTAMGEAGLEYPVFLPWLPGLDLDASPPQYGGPIVEVQPFTGSRARSSLFARAAIERFGEAPSPAMVYGFDAANLAIEALRSGGSGRVEVRRRLAELSGTEGASGTIRWDNGGGNTAGPVITELPQR